MCVIYCGVRGYLDKVDPAKITDFEKAFVEHIRGKGEGSFIYIDFDTGVNGATDILDILEIYCWFDWLIDICVGTQKPLLQQIAKDGHLSPDSDKALAKVVTEFLATFS